MGQYGTLGEYTPDKEKKGLECATRVFLTEFGSIGVTIYLPQNYIRAVLKLEKLPKDQLVKGKPRVKA